MRRKLVLRKRQIGTIEAVAAAAHKPAVEVIADMVLLYELLIGTELGQLDRQGDAEGGEVVEVWYDLPKVVTLTIDGIVANRLYLTRSGVVRNAVDTYKWLIDDDKRVVRGQRAAVKTGIRR